MLGPYRVLEALGEGGMGEVYRAHDTRLGRDVALKVLPAAVVSDPEWGQRLEREARAISALSHPHICPLYDIGHDQGMQYLVMECLEGETLAARLARGPLPPAQVIQHGIEIAGALHAAHRKGFVHRDLKPGNVMLTKAGAKLLDFGLAKAIPAPSAIPAAALTASAPLTAEGSLVGTIQYMAPEQLEGRDADARSDIFALGTVLYEMATGRRAFEGTSTATIIAAILERQPPPIAIHQPLAPAALDTLVRGCLAKDPEERWQTAHDVKLQLQSLQGAREAEPPVAGATRRGSVRERIAWGAAAVAVVAAVALGLSRREDALPSAAPTQGVRAWLPPPAGHSFTPNDFAISPDGRRIAFVAASADGVATLWVRAIDSSQATEVSGSDGARAPFWSADSAAIGYFAGANLWKVEPGGSGGQPLCAISVTAGGGAWNRSGDIVFSNAMLGPLMRIPATGGTPTPVTSVPQGSRGEAHRFPEFLPDGQRFLYVASWTTEQRGGLYLGRLDGGAATLVSPDIRGRVRLAGGQLIFLRGGTLFAQPFDLDAGRLTGTPRAVLQNELVEDWRFGDMPLSVSETGVMIYQSRLSYNSRLVWFDRRGTEQGPAGPPGYSSPAIAPDQRRIAVAFDAGSTGRQNIFVYDLERQVASQLTNAGFNTAIAWSPDGEWIAYSSQRPEAGVYRVAVNAPAREEPLLQSAEHKLVTAYSPDGRRVLFMGFATGAPDLHELDIASKRTHLVSAMAAEGSYSPDGRWILYVGASAGSLMVRSAADRSGSPLGISIGTGSQARWRADGKEIFFIAPDRKLMAVPVTERSGRLEPGAARALFQTRIVQPRLVLFQYDVTADGQRFLINSLPREDAAAPLTMLINWTQQLGT
jgi:Tol biopolymer transport system component